jgi:hypothetical protein
VPQIMPTHRPTVALHFPRSRGREVLTEKMSIDFGLRFPFLSTIPFRVIIEVLAQSSTTATSPGRQSPSGFAPRQVI